MSKTKTRKEEVGKRRRGRPPKQATTPISPPGTPDELAIAVLTTTPSELKEWEARQRAKR